jgi:DNA-binding XRE family transcriptional regulator
MTDTMTGKELRRARQKLQMTQKEIGHALDLHKNSIARMERDELPIVKTTELSVKYLLLSMEKLKVRR